VSKNLSPRSATVPTASVRRVDFDIDTGIR
jgi:hypothetical protein